ncbi:type I restriction-modification system, M subunit [Acinetobacter nectaris CIP 110549]|uniref:site-specific DNA-methyltransferase (adenine-specific) n=1 Tax=Acinetobacter nectaris CIP 110549 TaxID=1392540 RepID=V2TVC0_9GAMM|nr:type I restriction-modification system, M subunit [Acinetobacter nectaris CIP 110549]
MSQAQLQELKKHLWNIANDLRGTMGADEFRDYILGFIFYKYLSEKTVNFANALLQEEGINEPYYQLDESNAEHLEFIEAIQDNGIEDVGFALAPKQLFHTLAERGRQADGFILDDLTNTFKAIEQSTAGTDSENDFANLFEDLDLNSTKLGSNATDRNTLVTKVLSHLDKIDFDLSNTESDVLGDAYEYLIGEFASGAGKKAGEFYTPQAVSTLLAKIVTHGKTQLRSVYDPTCGSGSLLLRVKREVKDVDMIYGQEMNRTTYNLARMNMILHDVHFSKFDIKQDNTLTKSLKLWSQIRPSLPIGQPILCFYRMIVFHLTVNLPQKPKQIWLLYSTCCINLMKMARWQWFFHMVYCSEAQVKVRFVSTSLKK